MIDGIVVTCTRCERSVEVFGRSEASVKRGWITLKEGCNEDNYYITEEISP